MLDSRGRETKRKLLLHRRQPYDGIILEGARRMPSLRAIQRRDVVIRTGRPLGAQATVATRCPVRVPVRARPAVAGAAEPPWTSVVALIASAVRRSGLAPRD